MFDFPNSPVNGSTITNASGATYEFDGTKWIATGGPQTQQLLIPISDRPPPVVSGGLWWDSTGLELYVGYNDGNSTQYVVANNTSGLPEAPSDGTAYGRSNGAWVNVLPLAGGTMAGPLNVTATGAPQARSVQAKFAERIDLLDYILPGDTDATAGLNRAAAAAKALNRPVRIQIPSGIYNISSAIAITLTGNQGIHLAGDSSATTVIQQTADADAFDLTVSNYGSYMLGGSLAVTGLSVVMAATTSSTRTALNITTNAVTGQTGVPLVIDDVVTTSHTSTAYWGVDISLLNVANIAYLSRIACNAITRSGTGIIIAGSSGCYTTGIYLRDITVTGHAIGLDLQNYLQGIQIFNYNTIGSTIAANCTPSTGLNLSIYFRGCYLHGKTNVQPTAANLLSSVAIVDSYFDSIGTVLNAGDNHVTFTNVPAVQLLGCTFNGPGTGGSSTANVTGLTINGATTTYETIIANNLFQAYANGGTGINIASGRQIQIRGNNFQNNTTNIVDNGTGTCFAETSISGTFYLFGTPQSTGTTAFVSAPLSSTATISTTASGVFQNNLTVGNNTATASSLFVNGAAGNARSLYYQTAGVVRWLLYADNVAEGGSNTGSNFNIRGYNDAGGGGTNYLSVNRATGLVSTPNGLASGAATFSGAVTLAADPAANLQPVTLQYFNANMPPAPPAGSASLPIMDGTAAVGVATTWARGDHVHPSDTSRYAASNPAGYQTAAQVTTSLGAYLPLTGGNVSGALAVAAPLSATQTLALSTASGALFMAGDTVAANANPLIYSYVTGAAAGALGALGFNYYYTTAAVQARVNTSRNGWQFYHDARAVVDATLNLRLMSSSGTQTLATTWDTTGGLNGVIGSTTPAAGSFTTLGSTGVLTVGGASNNALTITPGSATNTAIAISATGTPAAGIGFLKSGSFSTAGNTTLTLSSAVGTAPAILGFNVLGTIAMMMGLDQTGLFQLGGWSWSQQRLTLDSSGNLTVAGSITGTGGLNNTVIGATTPAAGSFTTVASTNGIFKSGTAGVGLSLQSFSGVNLLTISTAGNGVFTAGIDNSVIGATTPAAGTFTSVKTGSTTGPTWTTGAGAPSGTQPIGSLYSNTSGAVGARLYVSAGGGTWTAVAGV